jgi:hypothetical protein
LAAETDYAQPSKAGVFLVDLDVDIEVEFAATV